VLGPRPSPST